MCIPLTPMLLVLITVINIIHLSCFTESVSLRDIGKPTSRAEISSPSSLYLKAVKGAHIGSALTGVTSELTNSNRKKNSHKTPLFLLRRKPRIRLNSYYLILILLYLNYRKRETLSRKK